MTDAAVPAAPSRLHSVDLLRGIVMVIMALDHARDFFFVGAGGGDPELLAEPGAPLFFTRWITHFCAPVFVFLAGTGAFLSLGRGRSRGALAWFLLTRGLWLVLVELTLVRWGWTGSMAPGFTFTQVIFVLGVSMMVLAALLWLPLPAIAAVGALLVAGHNAFDGVTVGGSANPFAGTGGPLEVSALSGWQVAWLFLHEPAVLRFPGGWIHVARYPLVPWIGVMALGFAFGALLRRPDAERRRVVTRLGLALVAAFVGLRLANVYGDPWPWAAQGSAMATVIDFLNTQKYPPSLLFLLMTLGPAIALLPALERWTGRLAGAVETFGKVPMFYYLAHIPLLRYLAAGTALLLFPPGTNSNPLTGPTTGWGFPLPGVYLAWLVAVLLLYVPCRWWAGLKARHRDWTWLSYF